MLWVKNYGSDSDDQRVSIAIDSKEQIYLSGFFRDTLRYSVDEVNKTAISKGEYDYFIMKTNLNGNPKWVGSFGGPKDERGTQLVVDLDDNIISAGCFTDTSDLDPSIENDVFYSDGGIEMFIQKLNPCEDVFSSIDITVCKAFITARGKPLTETGIFYDTLTSNLGCDSIVTINLTVDQQSSNCIITSYTNGFSNEDYFYNNPVKDNLEVHNMVSESIFEVNIISMNGEISSAEYQWNGTWLDINTTSLADGVYIAQLLSEKGMTSFRFVKE